MGGNSHFEGGPYHDALRLFSGEHVRPTPLEKTPQLIVFYFEKSYPFLSDCEKHPFILKLLIRYEKSTLSLRFPDAQAYALKLPSGPRGRASTRLF